MYLNALAKPTSMNAIPEGILATFAETISGSASIKNPNNMTKKLDIHIIM